MRSVALFLLFSLVIYSTYHVMNKRLNNIETNIKVIFKEVPKTLIEEQYDFNVYDYYKNKMVDNRILWGDDKIEDNIYEIYDKL